MIPIRKGDGTGLSVPGFAEVRKGDGTVLYSAGGAIPDSEVLQSDGTWSVHQRPRSIREGDYTFFGWAESNGDIGVGQYDHTDGSVTANILSTQFTIADDHASPSIYIRPDDRLVVFWAPHSAQSNPDTIYWKISDNALDVTSFGSLNSFSSSADLDYPQPIEWDGDLRLYYRYGTGDGAAWKYRVSTDDGATFGTEQDFTNFVDEQWTYLHPYLDTTQANDRLHFALGDHRMTEPSIRHWYLEGGTYYTSDGTEIQGESDEEPAADIDGFEDDDLSEYNEGSTAQFTINSNSPVIEGDLSLKEEGTGDTELILSTSGNGLDNYPSQGNTFHTFNQCVESAAITGHAYGGPDVDNLYFVRIDSDTDTFQFYKYNSGSATLLDEATVTQSVGTTYVIETEWGTDDVHTHRLLETDGTELGVISATDTDHTTDSFGWYDSGGTGDLSAHDAATMGSFDGLSEGGELTNLDDLTTVYDGTESGNNPPKQYDLIVDDNGYPHVAFTEHVSTGTGGGDGDYRARWAGWNGSSWDVGAEITAMGGAMPKSHYYEGGLGLDSQDPTTVYVSVEQDGRNYQIQEWATNDSGSTWSKSRDLSPADAGDVDPTKRGGPISPRGHDETDLPVMWFAGVYDDWEDGYNTEVVGLTE